MAYREVSEILPRRPKSIRFPPSVKGDSSEHSENDTTPRSAATFKPFLERHLQNRVMDQQQYYDPNSHQNGGQQAGGAHHFEHPMPQYPVPPQYAGQPYIPPDSEDDDEYDEERLMQVGFKT